MVVLDVVVPKMRDALDPTSAQVQRSTTATVEAESVTDGARVMS
jgi:hypothetical protein